MVACAICSENSSFSRNISTVGKVDIGIGHIAPCHFLIHSTFLGCYDQPHQLSRRRHPTKIARATPPAESQQARHRQWQLPLQQAWVDVQALQLHYPGPLLLEADPPNSSNGGCSCMEAEESMLVCFMWQIDHCIVCVRNRMLVYGSWGKHASAFQPQLTHIGTSSCWRDWREN
jgi:hypothetical protein